ncbi:hypothetical protein Salat_2501400 [Sesamum alatum]|uniref:Uncharacterized protein n=1 Tax=Sesamum alatum TaxID=300844 RepID=A0AAE1XSF7_9LAMI|nr:hypothetical protein Salat_2501400 [Sesamum alatum]
MPSGVRELESVDVSTDCVTVLANIASGVVSRLVYELYKVITRNVDRIPLTLQNVAKILHQPPLSHGIKAFLVKVSVPPACWLDPSDGGGLACCTYVSAGSTWRTGGATCCGSAA